MATPGTLPIRRNVVIYAGGQHPGHVHRARATIFPASALILIQIRPSQFFPRPVIWLRITEADLPVPRRSSPRRPALPPPVSFRRWAPIANMRLIAQQRLYQWVMTLDGNSFLNCTFTMMNQRLHGFGELILEPIRDQTARSLTRPFSLLARLYRRRRLSLRNIAVAMSLHQRIGAHSILGTLGRDLVLSVAWLEPR